MKKYALLILLMIILTSCSRGGVDYRPDPETERFYSGNEGVRMFIDPGAPPPRIYYYKDIPEDENAFSIDIELSNEGASWTKGGVYVSGYDPSLIFLEHINIPKRDGGWGNCFFDFDVNNLGGSILDIIGGIGLTGSCSFEDWGIQGGRDSNGDWRIGTNDLLKRMCPSCPDIDVRYDSGSNNFNLNFDFSAIGVDVDLLHHGKALMLLLDTISFDRFNGQEFFLEPDNHNYPGGGRTLITFPGYVQDAWPTGLDEIDVQFLVTSCYAYSTYATPIVCIDPNPYSEDEKVCYPGQVDLRSTQGAPVAVSRVIQENTPRSVIFTIEVQNVGNGKIIHPGYLELCSPYYPGRLGLQHTDTVILGDIRMSGSDQRLRCTPDNHVIKLRDGKGRITCTYDLEYATARSAYTAPLIMELWYGYSETQRKSVRVKRVS